MTKNPWFIAIRPKTLPAGAAPVIIGVSLAYQDNTESFSALMTLLILVCALLLQVSSNLINDYYDGIKGLDNEARLGPPRATSLGLLYPHQVKKGFSLCLAASFLIGLYLMYQGGLPIVIIGMSSLFFAWAYTGGPYPLSYYGLGEVFAFLFFGPIPVWGTYYLLTLEASHPLNYVYTLLWGSSIGLISSALMGVNNLRDRNSDAENNKMTIATIIGNWSMRKLIILLLISSQFISQTLLYQNQKPHLYFLVGLTPFFFFSTVWWKLLRQTDGADLNNTLASVGKYIFIFSLTYAFLIGCL